MWTTVYTCVCVVLVQPTYTTESAQPFDGCAGLLPSAVQKGTDHQTQQALKQVLFFARVV